MGGCHHDKGPSRYVSADVMLELDILEKTIAQTARDALIWVGKFTYRDAEETGDQWNYFK